MKKDFTRDYVTEAFRIYALMGKPTYDKAKEIISQSAADIHGRDPAVVICRAEKEIADQTPLLLDILAVQKTLEILDRAGKRYISGAVAAVYFEQPDKPISRGEISRRVTSYSLSCPADESSTYRWLKHARLLCAAIRGLRITPAEVKTIKYLFPK